MWLILLLAFQNDLFVRFHVCDYQVRCFDGACAVKWQCPGGFK